MKKRNIWVLISLVTTLLLSVTAYAQEPRPTPTNVPQQTTETGRKGTIQGAVYEDVNGDGRCVGTGVEGENPVEGVDIEFVSSDQETIITLYSGPEGIYGLYAAGFSYWGVSARPNADWVVTSEETLYVPVYEDSLAQTGVNFCVQKASQARQRVLPNSGAPALPLSSVAFVGIFLIVLGLGLHFKKQASS